MPNCPDYFSGSKRQRRKSRETKLKEKDQNELAKAFHLSLEQSEQQQKQNHCETLQDIKQKIILQSPWKLVVHENSFSICTVTNFENVGPKISKAIPCTYCVYAICQTDDAESSSISTEN